MKKLEEAGFYIALYGMAIVLVWIGIFKFTPTEASGIKSLVENSPLMSWMYHLMSQSTVSSVIGSIEIVTGGLLIFQPISPKSGLLGGILSAITFIVTLSFIFTTPGAFGQVDGIWMPDQFLLKDLMALGISIFVISKTAEQLKLQVQKQGNPGSLVNQKHRI